MLVRGLLVIKNLVYSFISFRLPLKCHFLERTSLETHLRYYPT